ncbi:conserved domain protein [delta proteobacterium NaphS2]|nr:conserved domain protein [delta proteobacterium NaphS2]
MGQIEELAQKLKGRKRIFLWGIMGVGKSTLALELARWFGRHHGGGRILALDPGSPAFGVPGALNRGRWDGDTLHWDGCRALCSLDAARFRLPLVQAAGRLLNDASRAGFRGPLVIDPPGVVRGVAGAELLTALVRVLQVDQVLALVRKGTSLPLGAELTWLPVEVLERSAPPDAARPPRGERAARRTGLWDTYLAHSTEETYSLPNTLVLGTPPPQHLPHAWAGRQAALLDTRGRTLGMGEVTGLTHGILTLRMPAHQKGAVAGILIRDAGRNARGCLETIPHAAPLPQRRVPPEMRPLDITPDPGSAPVFSHVGPAWATLVGGVFGDPLVHVRLRNQRRGILFDLGSAARLAPRVVHQVSAVCLSHAHLDHIAGFLWFLRTRIGAFGPCKIFGPPKTLTRIENFLGAVTWDRIENNAPVFEVGEFDGAWLKRARLTPGSPKVVLPALPVEEGVLLKEDMLSIKAVVCDHKIPSLAYALTFHMEIRVRKDRLTALGLAPGPWLGLLKACIASKRPEVEIDLPDGTRRSAGELGRALTIIRPGRKLVYAADMADTAANREKVTALADGAHTLFCEAPFAMAHEDKARATQHLTTLAAVEIARKARVARLVPFHFSKRYEKDPAAVFHEILSAAGPVKIIGHFHPSGTGNQNF